MRLHNVFLFKGTLFFYIIYEWLHEGVANFSKQIREEPPQFCDGSLLTYRIFYISLLTQDCFQILLYGRNWDNVIIFYQQVQYIRRDKCR